MPNKKQKVKIFRRKYGKHPKTGKHCMLEDLEQAINDFLKGNPDHRITSVQYIGANGFKNNEEQSETAFVVFDVTESSTGSGGGGGNPKPSGGKPRGRPRKSEDLGWNEGQWIERSERMREQHKIPTPTRRIPN